MSGPARTHPLLCRYGIPLLAASCALAGTAILPFLADATFLLLEVAVVVSTWYGGRIAGLVAVLAGGVGSVFFQLPPLYSFRIAEPRDVGRLAAFMLTAAAIIWFLHSRQRLLDRLTNLLEQAGRRERVLRQKHEEVIHAGKLATIGQLAAGITHELNNPLNNVNLYLSVLRDLARTHELDHAKLMLAIGEAQRQIKRAAEIVSHLRLFARGGEAPRRPCSLDEAIHRALSFVQEPLRLASVTATFTRSPMEILIEGNETQLEQVFVNLLLNAQDAMSQSPTKRITITTKVEDGSVTVEVEDTGPGIAPEIRHRLFAPFITTKPSGSGLGLGLSICASIMSIHQGRITAGRSPAGGARFILTFPVWEVVPRMETASDRVSP